MSDDGAKAVIGCCVISVLVVSATLIGVSLQRLSTNQVGLKYDVNARDLDSQVMSSGLYNGVCSFHTHTNTRTQRFKSCVGVL